MTDINLGATDPRFADEQTEVRFPAHIAEALHGQTLYANLEVLPRFQVGESGLSRASQGRGCREEGSPD